MADIVIEPAGSDYDIDEDEKVHNETMAAGEVENERPYIRFIGSLPNSTKEEGDSLRLRCEVDGTLPITFRWFINEIPVTQRKKNRVIIKTKDNISRLRISTLETSDTAYYRCEARNTAGLIKTEGIIRVTGGAFLNKNNGQSDYKSGLRPPVEHENGKSIAGTCQIYSGQACSRYLAGQRVYIPTDEIEMLLDIERNLQAAMIQINNMSHVSEPCKVFAETASCYHKYEICDAEKDEKLSICRAHCILLENDLCQDEYKAARDGNLVGNHKEALLPECSALPLHVNKCIKILNHTEEPQEAHVCYNGNGNSYRGTTHVTESGNVCKRWSEARRKFPQYKSTTYLELTDNNFCRNPGGEKSRPWCFTMDDKEEYCNISNCPPGLYPEIKPNDNKKLNTPVDGKNGNNSNDQSSNQNAGFLGIPMPYVYMAAGIVGVLLLAILILALYKCIKSRKEKQKKVSANGHCSNGARKPQPCLQTPEHQLEMMHLMGQRNGQYGPANDAIPEYPMSSVRFLELLGEGQFGTVYKGELTTYGQDEEAMSVALKTLKDDAAPRLKKDFEQETCIVARLRHPNIVQLIGISKTAQSQCMIFEYMIHGDLHEFLLLRSPYSQMDVIDNERIMLDHGDFLHIATQIASGMEYLAAHHYVHRDLAARNCLVTDRLIIKISDFGLTRDVYANDYYMCNSKKHLPIRWMPPEAVYYGKYSELADVWSFGVTLWEMYSYGMQPYYRYSNDEVINLVSQRGLLECPENCPTRMYSLMVECWHETPSKRPRFAELHGRLQTWSVVSSPAHSAVNAAVAAMANGNAMRSSSVMSGNSSGHVSTSTVGQQQQAMMNGNALLHQQQNCVNNSNPMIAVRNSPYGRSNIVLPAGSSPTSARLNGNVPNANGGVYNVRNQYGFSETSVDSASSVS